MKRALWIIPPLAALVAAAPAVADEPVLTTDHAGINLGALGQLLGFAQHVDDPFKNDGRAYLFLKEARLRGTGHYDDYTFEIELGLGPEEAVAAPNPGIALGLLDFDFNIPIHAWGSSYLKVGQFKVPYGREALTYSAFMSYADRSIDSVGFRVGRDVGAAVTLNPGPATIIAGVFTGGGRDVPPYHYLPEKLGAPLFALRAGVGDVDHDTDAYHLRQSDQTVDKPRFAFFVNGLVARDSLIGHSTVLNVKEADKSIMIDSNWNPYIGRAPLSQGDFWQAGADAALRAPLGKAFALSAEAEWDYSGYSNPYGALHMNGVRGQVAIDRKPFEVAARYAVLLPSPHFATNGVSITGTEAIHELTPALSWYVHRDHLKLVADLPLLFNVPVISEKNVGDYVATELPGQTSILGKTGTVGPQNVVEARLMLQGYF